jgi:hypothetical protein
MRLKASTMLRLLISVILLSASWTGCSGSREETVAGVQIPIPSGMKKIEGQGVELSLPGFGGGNASFQGNLDAEKVIEFYKKEMPARGWKQGMGILSRGGMLGYTKEGKSLLVAVSSQSGVTSLNITVGTSGN